MKNYFAIIIGVGGDLPATEKDAKAIYNILTDPNKGGYHPKNIRLLINQDSTKENVIKAFDTLINATKKMKKSTVIIYYSGHGNRYQNQDGSFDYYLKTHGGNSSNKEETMLNGKIFSEKINSLKSDKLLVLLDCCHAAGIKKNQLTKKSGEINNVTAGSSRHLLEQLHKGKGKVFISSCDDNEQSVVLPAAENSLFTEVALEALNGYICISEEFVGVIDLIYHVIKEVPKRVKPFDHVQRPIINEITDLSPDYYVCKNGSFQPDIPSDVISTMLIDKLKKGEVRPMNYKDGFLLDMENDNNGKGSVINLTGHAEMKVGKNEMKKIDQFLSNINFENKVSNQQKTAFVNQIGGIESLGKMKTFFSEHNINIQNIAAIHPDYNLQKTVNSALEFATKLNYINEYNNKI